MATGLNFELTHPKLVQPENDWAEPRAKARKTKSSILVMKCLIWQPENIHSDLKISELKVLTIGVTL